MSDFATQSGCKSGPQIAIAGETLTGMEGRLVKKSNSSGSPMVILPNGIADDVLYVLVEGGASGEPVTIEPLVPGKQFRAVTDDALVTGDNVTLAAIDGTKDGTVRKLPAGAGTYNRVALAEQSAAAGSLALLMSCPRQIVQT